MHVRSTPTAVGYRPGIKLFCISGRNQSLSLMNCNAGIKRKPINKERNIVSAVSLQIDTVQYIEEKAKVVAAVWGMEFIQKLCCTKDLAPGSFEEKDQLKSGRFAEWMLQNNG